jgi:superfamily II DNA or RNA helicase
MTLDLRPYQEQAIDAVEASEHQRPAVLLPTGMGKTFIFSEITRRAHARGIPSLVLVHRDELASQTVASLHILAPKLRIGVVKAGRDEHGPGIDAVVASVQTLARASRRSRIDGRRFGRLIVDECHHAAADSYLNVLDHFGAFDADSGVRAIGFTATMSREDSRGLGDVWQNIVYAKDIRYGIRHGYLCDVEGKTAEIDGLDLSKVKRVGGDYAEGSLSDALLAADAGTAIAEALREHAIGADGQVRRTILFTPTVATAVRFATDLNDSGIPCDVITGETPVEDRRAAFERFRAGTSRVLINCMVLTEGFDAPWAEVACIARATTSRALYVQMVGRVLRPWAGKARALVLDMAGVAGRLKLATLADLSTTPITIEEDETLAEAMERAESEGAGEEELSEVSAAGRFRNLAAVDLFEQSHSAWLQTPRGHWFLQVPTPKPEGRTIFTWPEFGPDGQPGTWRVGVCGAYSPQYGHWPHRNLPIELAMSVAEDLADKYDPSGSIARRSASWRRRGGRPSEAQLAYAIRLGIDPTGLNKPQLSDQISIAHASRILDRG